ncbi:MAG: HEPN domain-containing protein [Oscillospiraceae bacterium]|nr:HEPN domain-containing protein [Oscillospiraceae bacterium]
MKNLEAAEWFRFAQTDFQAAIVLSKNMHPKPLELICYHCQQSTEKFLKGFIIGNSVSAPNTHDLLILHEMCVKIDKRFEDVKNYCKFLTLFGVLPRYPYEIDITESDTDRALEYSQKVIDFFNSCNLI